MYESDDGCSIRRVSVSNGITHDTLLLVVLARGAFVGRRLFARIQLDYSTTRGPEQRRSRGRVSESVDRVHQHTSAEPGDQLQSVFGHIGEFGEARVHRTVVQRRGKHRLFITYRTIFSY